VKIFNIDWREFLDTLPIWGKLPLEARRVFVEEVKTGQAITSARHGQSLDPLINAGFLRPLKTRPGVTLPKPYRPFARVMRAMHRYPVFDNPGSDVLTQYIWDHFNRNERQDFLWNVHSRYVDDRRVALRAMSAEWLERFLGLEDAEIEEWESCGSVFGTSRHGFISPRAAKTAKATKTVLRRLMELPGPVEFRDLGKEFSGIDSALWAAVIPAGLRHLLFYVALRQEDLEPMLGIWPGITHWLHRPPAQAPKTVRPKESFCSAFLMDDMTTILSECVSEPLRVRANDYKLFVKTEKALAERLISLPEWADEQLGYSAVGRVAWAVYFLKATEYVTFNHPDRKRVCLEATPKGREWLALNGKQRLKKLLGFLKRKDPEHKGFRFATSNRMEFVPFNASYGGILSPAALRSAVEKAFADIREGKFYDAAQFFEYQARQDNPFLQQEEKGKQPSFGFYSPWDAPPAHESEQIWSGTLNEFLLLRLVPLGGAQIGLLKQDRVCFALTDVGLTFLGRADDFAYEDTTEGEVVIQPNFDVVFLSPSPVKEAEIGRLAKRQGKRVGTLFKITKQSILAAAAAGLTADDALRTLQDASSRDIPKNVAREIRGWFAQCRQVAMGASILIYCPDPETASRVKSCGGKHVAAITDTILELKTPKEKASLLRKLRKLGVFCRSE